MKICSLPLAIVLAAGIVHADNVPRAIPVVATWDQLRNVAVVATGDFGTVRVGVEQLAAPKLGGVLVYALVQRTADNELITRFTQDDVLGPLTCRIYRKHAPVVVRAKLLAEAGVDDSDARELLYTRAVYVDAVGEYVVDISSNGELPLARATIQGMDKAFHPWTPLSRSRKRQTLQPAREDREFHARLSACPRGLALPAHDGMVPIARLSDKQRTRNEPLPTLIPKQASTTLSLNGDVKQLLIQSDTDMIVARPDWHYLARWWVNDKPFIAKPLEQLTQQNGMITHGRRIRVSLDFDAADFGAKSGDTMGLQLLHLPSGWRPIDSYGVVHVAAADDEPNVSRMTNRIEFTAP